MITMLWFCGLKIKVQNQNNRLNFYGRPFDFKNQNGEQKKVNSMLPNSIYQNLSMLSKMKIFLKNKQFKRKEQKEI
jgi:hypothetical protein